MNDMADRISADGNTWKYRLIRRVPIISVRGCVEDLPLGLPAGRECFLFESETGEKRVVPARGRKIEDLLPSEVAEIISAAKERY